MSCRGSWRERIRHMLVLLRLASAAQPHAQAGRDIRENRARCRLSRTALELVVPGWLAERKHTDAGRRSNEEKALTYLPKSASSYGVSEIASR